MQQRTRLARRWREFCALAVSTVMVITSGCGGIHATGDASGPRTTSPSAQPSPDQTAGWKTYISPKWGYSIRYPETWLDLPNYGAPDTEKYFSNESVGAPDDMDANGIFFSISVYRLPGNVGLGEPQNATQCLQHDIAVSAVERQYAVSVNGVASQINALVIQGTPELETNLVQAGTCYWFGYFFHSISLRDSTATTTAQLMLGETFRFTAAVVSPS